VNLPVAQKNNQKKLLANLASLKKSYHTVFWYQKGREAIVLTQTRTCQHRIDYQSLFYRHKYSLKERDYLDMLQHERVYWSRKNGSQWFD
jgi:hypothetical protein